MHILPNFSRTSIKILWFLVLLFYITIVSADVVFAETAPTQAWVARYNGPANGSDNATKITTDALGNIYVTGNSRNERTGSSDYTTVKYDTDGNQLWVARYDNGKYENVADLAVDALGNAYVTGSSRGGDTADFATVKYDTDGNQLWVARYDSGSKNEDGTSAIAIDNLGNVYVTGYSHIYSPYHVPYNSYTTVKYDTDGNQLWVARYDNGIDNVAYALSVDALGNAYVTGQSQGIGGYDYLTIKYSPNGNQLWSARYDSGGSDQANALSIDITGGVYVAGYSNGYTIVRYNSDGTQIWVAQNSTVGYFSGDIISVDTLGNAYIIGHGYNGRDSDYATAKYDTKGNQLWVVMYDGGGRDYSSALFVDAIGNVYVTGQSSIHGTDYDYATVKYDTDGNQLWVARYDNSPRDYAKTITVDTAGNVYITGSSFYAETGEDYTTVKYSPAGNPTILLPGILGSWTDNFFEPFTNPNPIAQNKLSLTEESQSWIWKQLDDLGYLPHTWQLPKTFLPVTGHPTYKCPYDWRNNNQYNAEHYLIPCINKAKQETGASKVNIVAHSMGGLVARAYVQNDALYRNDIARLAFVGTPNHGSPEAYYFWEGADLTHGWFGILGAVMEKVVGGRLFQMGVHYARMGTVAYAHGFFPSMRELLPTFDYLKDQFGNTRDITTMLWQNTLLKDINTRPNITKLTDPVTSKVFAGENHQTLEKIPVLYPNPDNLAGNPLRPYPDGQPVPLLEENSLSGDGTVLSQKSSKITETDALFEIKTKMVGDPENFLEHANLPNSFFNEILTFLGGTATTTPAYAPRFPDAMLAVSLASPADLLVIGPDGKKLGFDTPAQAEAYEITKGIYSGRNDLELAAIIDPQPWEYTVLVTGNDAGEFNTGISYAKKECEGSVNQDNYGVTATGTVTVFTLTVQGGCGKDSVAYSLDSTIDIDPDTLNLSSKGSYITAYIELPNFYKAEDINVSTIKFNGQIPALSSPAAIGDYDNDGIRDLMVKFKRDEVQRTVTVGKNKVIVSGNLSDGTKFAGKDTINIINNPPQQKLFSFFDFLFVLLGKISLASVFSSFK